MKKANILLNQFGLWLYIVLVCYTNEGRGLNYIDGVFWLDTFMFLLTSGFYLNIFFLIFLNFTSWLMPNWWMNIRGVVYLKIQ